MEYPTYFSYVYPTYISSHLLPIRFMEYPHLLEEIGVIWMDYSLLYRKVSGPLVSYIGIDSHKPTKERGQ